MQIGTTELLLIVLFLIIVFGLARSESTGSTTDRERAQARDAQARRGDSAEGSSPKPRSGRDPYSVLEISPQATSAEVTAAYRRMAQMYHPDKVAGLAPEYRVIAEKRMKEINAAYEQLRGDGV